MRTWQVMWAVLGLATLAICGAVEAQETSPSETKLAVTAEKTIAAQSLRDKLASQVNFDLHGKTLADLPAWLRDQHGVKAVLDVNAIKEAGVELNSPLKLRLNGVSLRSALRHLLRRHDLTWKVAGEVLVVSTPEEAQQHDRVAVYAVSDLVDVVREHGETRFDCNNLLDILQSCVAGDRWNEGEHPFAVIDGTIAFPQSEDVHEQVAWLLAALRAAKQRAANEANAEVRPIDVGPAGNQKIRAALAKPTQLEFTDTPLEAVAKQLSDAYAIPVLLDQKAIEEAGLSLDTPLSLDGRGLPLGQSLRYLLAARELIAVVRDEALVFTTIPEAEQSDVGLRVYPVADLVTPGDEPSQDDAAFVVEAIEACYANSWEGTPGQSGYLPACQAIVVAQFDEVHEAIEQVLSDLRKARAEQGGVLRTQPDDNELVLKVYRLAQFPQESEIPVEVVAAFIQEFVAPETWTKDPDVRLRAAPDRLVIRQRRGVHKQIAKFLEELGPGPERGMGGTFY